jgi:hypothetical protein
MSTFPPRQNTAKGKWFDKMIVNTQIALLSAQQMPLVLARPARLK